MTVRVEVFVDYVCPFCLLVEGAVEELQRERDVEVRIRPFELRPNPLPTLKPEDDYLPRIWSDAVYPMAERFGVSIQLPTISPQPRTAMPFVVLQLAQERGVAQEYSAETFRAFFQQDLDIGDEDVVVEIATRVGLDSSDVEMALRSDERRARQAADQRYTVEVLGVTSVPSFLVNGRLYPGVLTAKQLKRIVDDAAGSEV